MFRCDILYISSYYTLYKCPFLLGSIAGLSKQFKKFGVPTLLVYKNGQVIGNFVHITDHLGIDFYSSDVEAFLIEHGILTDKNCIPLIVSKTENGAPDSE